MGRSKQIHPGKSENDFLLTHLFQKVLTVELLQMCMERAKYDMNGYSLMQSTVGIV